MGVGRTLNVHTTIRRCPRRLLNVMHAHFRHWVHGETNENEHKIKSWLWVNCNRYPEIRKVGSYKNLMYILLKSSEWKVTKLHQRLCKSFSIGRVMTYHVFSKYWYSFGLDLQFFWDTIDVWYFSLTGSLCACQYFCLPTWKCSTIIGKINIKKLSLAWMSICR